MSVDTCTRMIQRHVREVKESRQDYIFFEVEFQVVNHFLCLIFISSFLLYPWLLVHISDLLVGNSISRLLHIPPRHSKRGGGYPFVNVSLMGKREH
jgi:hypothetical protein